MSSWVMMAQIYFHFQERLGPGRVSIASWKQMHRDRTTSTKSSLHWKVGTRCFKRIDALACIMLLHSHSKGSPLSHVCWVFQLRAPGNARDTCLQQKHAKTICQGQQGQPPRCLPKTNTYSVQDWASIKLPSLAFAASAAGHALARELFVSWKCHSKLHKMLAASLNGPKLKPEWHIKMRLRSLNFLAV